MAKKTKNFAASASQVDKDKYYPATEALALAKKVAFAKFDETVEISVRLGVDPRHADQMVQGSVVLPHGTGRNVRILVFAKGEKAKEAEQAGADIVGDDELIAKVDGGWLQFDIVVATPDMMAKVGRLGKKLGPRGLMPKPKIGTVTNDLAGIIKQIRDGLVEFRVEKAGIVHCIIGKKSFDDVKLFENLKVFFDTIVKAKPATSKGVYVKGAAISTTMGPGIKLDVADLMSQL